MPLDPQYSSYTPGVQGCSYTYGAEYEHPIGGATNDDATCAVCYVSTRETQLMLPAKTSCLASWTRDLSTMVTSCRHIEGMVGIHRSYVLTERLNQCKVVKAIELLGICTMLKPSVVPCHVFPMLIIKN